MLHKNFVIFKTLQSEGKQYIVEEQEVDFGSMMAEDNLLKSKNKDDDDEEKMEEEHDIEQDPVKSIKAFK